MGKFTKGHSGGPGRPAGSRNAANRVLDALAAEGAEAILRKTIELAQAGDARAAEMVLKRAWPQPKGRVVDLDLPPIEVPADLVRAHAALVTAMGARTITPEEASSVSSVLERQRQAIVTADHEPRIRELEDEEKARRIPQAAHGHW